MESQIVLSWMWLGPMPWLRLRASTSESVAMVWALVLVNNIARLLAVLMSALVAIARGVQS